MYDIRDRNLPPLIPPGMTWNEERRRQIIEIFTQEVFGEIPPLQVTTGWTLVEETPLPGIGTRQRIDVILVSGCKTFSFPLFLYLPETAQEKVPIALYIENKPRIPVSAESMLPRQSLEQLMQLMGSQGPIFHAMLAETPKPKPCDIEHTLDNPYWPVADLLKQGIATAAFYTEDLAADKETDYENGLFGFFGGNRMRNSHSWGAISVWSYGAQKAIDVLAAHTSLNPKKIAVIGHSRGGKTALWSTANDSRISCCYANNSGCTGAALSRGKTGEQLLHINTFFPYWFCEKYRQYNKREDELPIDQHMLLALAAPRPLYLASATKDLWADPVSEFLSAREASAVYEALGLKGLCCDSLPAPGSPSQEGMIGYHVREGGHALTCQDWMQFLSFWKKHWY